MDPKSRLVSAIRGWIHMDNLVESLNQQANNARTLRSKHEGDAIQLLKQLGMSSSKIQVSGGTELQLAHRKTQTELSWAYLEREIPAWATKSGLPEAHAASLLKWLQDHRESREKDYLKKIAGASKDARAHD